MTNAKIMVRDLQGKSFYLRSWTGRLMLVSAFFFLLISLKSESFFLPDTKVLLLYGAKDPVLVALGEYWRLLMPLLLHVGPLHFVLNMVALKVVGPHIEDFLGPWWFLLVYVVTGTFGNICSSFFNLALGAGASGSIFGLIGIGVVAELLMRMETGGYSFTQGVRGVRDLFRNILAFGPFSALALINLGFAAVVNLLISFFGVRIAIDNAAHLGGVFAGMTLGYAFLFFRGSSFLARNRWVGTGLVGSLVVFGVASAAYLARSPFVRDAFASAADRSDDKYQAYYYYTQGLKIDPTASSLHFKRGRILLLNGEIGAAYADLIDAAGDKSLDFEFTLLRSDLEKSGRTKEIAFLDALRRSTGQ